MKKLTRVRSAVPLRDFLVRVEFTDGTARDIDLGPYLRGPVFEHIRKDHGAFRSLRVDAEAGTIVWDNGADIDPDVLYKGLKPAWQDSSELAAR